MRWKRSVEMLVYQDKAKQDLSQYFIKRNTNSMLKNLLNLIPDFPVMKSKNTSVMSDVESSRKMPMSNSLSSPQLHNTKGKTDL